MLVHYSQLEPYLGLLNVTDPDYITGGLCAVANNYSCIKCPFAFKPHHIYECSLIYRSNPSLHETVADLQQHYPELFI